ncbi:hypothetical protein CPB83DRAFT_773622, partial [Crepidotus variabilis]
GIQLFMCIYGFTVFLESTPTIRKGLRSYMIVSFLILSLFIVSQIPDGYEIFTLLSKSTNAVKAVRLRKKEDHTWWKITSTCTLTFVNWIGDGLLLYRLWILWVGRRWVLALVMTVYLASVGVIATYNNPWVRFNARTLSAWIFLSVAVNCLVTGLILYRLLSVRREVHEVMPKRDLEMYYGVTATLVESALPLSLAGIIYAAAMSSPVSAPARIISGMSNILWFSLTALAPQMIIFRVVMGRSWMHKRRRDQLESLEAVRNDDAVSSPITFECSESIHSGRRRR